LIAPLLVKVGLWVCILGIWSIPVVFDLLHQCTKDVGLLWKGHVRKNDVRAIIRYFLTEEMDQDEI
jgi:hypothetical protein